MDLYSVLGVNRSATKQQIKEAYRKQALQHHPDKHAEQSERVRADHAFRFREASEAYDILGDDVKREMYNRSGRTAAARAGASGHSRSASHGYGGSNTNYNYTYQGARATYTRPRRGLWSIAQMIAARSSRGDALFHAAMLGCVLGGGLIAGNAGDWLWQSSNRGKLFSDVERHAQQKGRRRAAADHQDAAAMDTHPQKQVAPEDTQQTAAPSQQPQQPRQDSSCTTQQMQRAPPQQKLDAAAVAAERLPDAASDAQQYAGVTVEVSAQQRFLQQSRDVAVAAKAPVPPPQQQELQRDVATAAAPAAAHEESASEGITSADACHDSSQAAAASPPSKLSNSDQQQQRHMQLLESAPQLQQTRLAAHTVQRISPPPESESSRS